MLILLIIFFFSWLSFRQEKKQAERQLPLSVYSEPVLPSDAARVRDLPESASRFFFLELTRGAQKGFN